LRQIPEDAVKAKWLLLVTGGVSLVLASIVAEGSFLSRLVTADAGENRKAAARLSSGGRAGPGADLPDDAATGSSGASMTEQPAGNGAQAATWSPAPGSGAPSPGRVVKIAGSQASDEADADRSAANWVNGGESRDDGPSTPPVGEVYEPFER
jgi:hypothetical protein